MPFFAWSQQIVIQGIVVDTFDKPVADAIIVITPINDASNILSFASTNSSGKYSLEINKVLSDSLLLTVRHLEYKTFQNKIAGQSATINIILSQSIEQLKEVLIIAPKTVKIKGNTITYNVDGLKAKKDYTIEEVIARIPGITISENGQIQYLEKAISHLYINGLDLLDGQYNIATKGIPATAVQEIDVLTKHNHEQINIGRAASDKVALNLKIKQDQSVIFGSSKNEAGLPFLTGLVDVTPIYIKNKFQNISSFKVNNIGESLKAYSQNESVEDANILSLKLFHNPVINPTNTNGLVLSNKYWLDNNSVGATNNALLKITDSTLVKCSVNVINESTAIQKQSFSTFLGGSTANEISVANNNSLKTCGLQMNLIHEVNKRQFFFKNAINFKVKDDNGLEQIVLNANSLSSNYRNLVTKFSNSLFVKNIIGKDKILNSGLIFEYEKQVENLMVTPPTFPNIIASDATSTSTNQIVEVAKFNVAGYTDYAFDWLKCNWNVQQNLTYNNFNFNSSLEQLPSVGSNNFPFQSDFKFHKIETSSQLRLNKNIGKMVFKLQLSADFNTIKTKEYILKNNSEKSDFLFFQPFFQVGYTINSKWNSGISYSKNTAVSDFEQIFQPIIMTSYNTLSQNPPIINSLRTTSFTPFLSYNNILNSFFCTIKGSFSSMASDVTFTSQLNNLGFITTTVLERPNTINSNSVSVNFTKSILGFLKTDMSYTHSFSDNKLFFNNQFLTVKNRSHSLNVGLSVDNGSWYSFEYKVNYRHNFTMSESNNFDNMFLFHTTNLDFYTTSNTQIHFGIESAQTKTLTNNSTNTMFNGSFLYKPSKKLFIKIALLNLFDTAFFSTAFTSVNASTITQFALRPRQITFGLTYSL